MKNFFSIITMNVFGFDLIIFLVAIGNAFIYYLAKKSADRLYKKMHLTIFVPGSRQSKIDNDKELRSLKESDIVNMRNIMGRLYSVFVNLTGIFPLLGILGTVSSLLGLVENMSKVETNFYGALTSTFWGLIFAIIFKLLDGVISAEIEDNEKTVQLFLERNSVKNTEKADKNEQLL